MAGSSGDNTDQPLKIFMTADAVGGVWQYSVDLIRGLVDQGAEVQLATMGPRPTAAQKRQLFAIPGVQLAESDCALEWMPNRWKDVDSAGGWLLDLASDFKADIIHLNGYAHAALPWRKPVVVAAHSCVYSWWRAVHGSVPGEEWAEYKRRVMEGLAASDCVVCPSAYIAHALEREYGVAAAKLELIHNFSFAPRWSGSEKENYLLAAGRMWDEAKNLSLLGRIAPRLKWQIRVAGNEPGPQNASPGADSLKLLGALPHPELLDEMDRAGIFVHPAFYEPFGLSVLEAARRRCSLVLSDIPSLRELWAGAAVFVNPHEPANWIFELNRLIDDTAKRTRLANLASLRANSFHPAAALAKYCNLYTSLLTPKHREKETAA